jgi:hypothetical protein
VRPIVNFAIGITLDRDTSGELAGIIFPRRCTVTGFIGTVPWLRAARVRATLGPVDDNRMAEGCGLSRLNIIDNHDQVRLHQGAAIPVQ